jgi:hypothetical protein
MDSVMGMRREAVAKLLATLVLMAGILVAGAGTAQARHGADDGLRHHHHHHRHGADDGPRHR